MYKKNQNHQFSLGDFNQPMGLKLDPENKWIKKAAMIPWDEIEAVYADLFPSDCAGQDCKHIPALPETDSQGQEQSSCRIRCQD